VFREESETGSDSEKSRKALEQLRGGLGLAFPHDADLPAEISQLPPVLRIALVVPLEFRLPVRNAGLWNVRVDASGMLAPKAAMDLDNLHQSRKHDIRLSWERGDVKAVAVAHRIDGPAHGHFRRGVVAPDPAHVCRAAFGRKLIQASVSPILQ